MEKSFAKRPNFGNIHDILVKLAEKCVKYSDYLTQNRHLQADHRAHEISEPIYEKAFFELPHLSSVSTYKVNRERDAVESLVEALQTKDFYKPVSVDLHFVERHSYRYSFFKHLKEFGFPIENVLLFAQYYKGAVGNKHFVWREDLTLDSHLNNRHNVMEEVVRGLPKFFFPVHINTICEI